jgi:hypothetical protein
VSSYGPNFWPEGIFVKPRLPRQQLVTESPTQVNHTQQSVSFKLMCWYCRCIFPTYRIYPKHYKNMLLIHFVNTLGDRYEFILITLFKLFLSIEYCMGNWQLCSQCSNTAHVSITYFCSASDKYGMLEKYIAADVKG